MGTLRVTGKGILSLKPDTIVVKFTSSAVYDDYAEAIAMASEATKDLKAVIAKAGIDSELLKTRNLEVSPKYKSYYDDKDHMHQKFIGYEYTHSSHIKIDNDNKVLGRLLYEVSTSPLDVEFDISYTVKDIEKAKNDLLGEAIKDAKMKAKVLSEAAGVKLKEIREIDYSWGEFEIYSRPLNIGACEYRSAEPSDSFDIDIDADDIDVNDSVTVVWEIE
ncbi:SIMPL domain-containing protein [Fenollaria massiliensis]|uniref:SIMPL domain-containing protein n=1 Tax=Fenollaria massiliensis TaxID=938288 RepID=UPI0003758FCC|nr:SIMPL domain-containing protein [Fenollaria massiliensis]